MLTYQVVAEIIKGNLAGSKMLLGNSNQQMSHDQALAFKKACDCYSHRVLHIVPSQCVASFIARKTAYTG